jgi:hypothetical protein
MREQVVLSREHNSSLDVVPGILDLPSGFLRDETIEEYAKLLALFYDRIIIPDGWLHCYGPLSEYIRRHLRKGRTSSEFTGNTIFRLLENSILLPALRGTHADEDGPASGFNLYDVWSGVLRTDVRRSFGVSGLDPMRRMMIMDQEENQFCSAQMANENHTILSELSKRIRSFVSWDCPWRKVSEPAEVNVDHWNRSLLDASRRLIFDGSEIVTAPQDTATISGELIADDSSAQRALHQFVERLTESLGANLSAKDPRRGQFEHAVAQALSPQEDVRAMSYEWFYSRLEPSASSVNPFLGGRGGAQPRPDVLFGTIILDRISTIQELLFANKFNASAGRCDNWSPYVTGDEIFRARISASHPDQFIREYYSLSTAPVNIAALTVDQIITLRHNNERYFWHMRKPQPAANFWQANHGLRVALLKYIGDIVKAAPPLSRSKVVGRIGNGVIISGMAYALADRLSAWLLVGSMPIAVWASQEAQEIVRGWFSGKLEQFMIKRLAGASHPSQLDILSRLWHLKESAPVDRLKV